jgi:hypothetical protein
VGHPERLRQAARLPHVADDDQPVEEQAVAVAPDRGDRDPEAPADDDVLVEVTDELQLERGRQRRGAGLELVREGVEPARRRRRR